MTIIFADTFVVIKKHFLAAIILAAIAFAGCGSQPSETPLFTLLLSSQTNIHFVNHLNDRDKPGILKYLYYYNGGGVAVGDINNDGLPDLFFTANQKGGNKLYLNKGNYKFEDITVKAGVAGNADWSTGVTMADVNNDGYLDIYVCAVAGKLDLKGYNQLYINNHDGTFTESAAQYGLDFSGYSTQAAFFDYNHDGLLDCYLLNQSNHSVETFGDTTLRKKVSPLAGSKLYLNTGGHFEDVTAKAGIYSSALGYGLGVAVADLNNDGWEDIYIGNDFHENDYYYINNHNGTFTEAGAQHFNHYSRFSMGNDVADYNNDGQLDVVTADMLPGEENILKTYGGDESYDQYQYKIVKSGFQYQYSRNALQRNMGNGNAFSEQGLMNGVSATDWTWSPLFADFDNDCTKDLFFANGIKRRPTDMDYISFVSDFAIQRQLMSSDQSDSTTLDKMPVGNTHPYIFKGTPSEKFIDKSMVWGMSNSVLSNGAVYADLNNTGHLDLITNNVNSEASIYKHNGSSSNYLALTFTGTHDNRFGIGAKAYVFNKGKIQYQQLMLTRGFESSVAPKLHFGLGTAKTIDSLLIIWPNGSYQVIKQVKSGQTLKINQANASGHFEQDKFFKPAQSPIEDVTAAQRINWQHKEDQFVDFNMQPLIPHMLSAEGPRLAVADINGDGLDDIYACGAKDQPDALFIQEKNGGFKASIQPAFIEDAASEDVDAIFLDANHDGHPDVFVASGGNEYADGAPQLADRLYLNDGKGNFKKSATIPSILKNKSAVAVADVNHDGYSDIFIGGAPDAHHYGPVPENYLLLNDGKGNYTKAAISNDLKYAGMLRSASFADINNDGWPDLIVAGEWMPVKILLNKQGHFVSLKDAQMEQLSGWWQRVISADVDGDGKMDIIAGNYGLNSKLRPTTADPVKLYLSDLDKNGTVDPIVTYSVNGKDFTFLGKGEIEKQVPLIKKKYLYYHDFAGKTVQELFGDSLDVNKMMKVTSFASGVFYNKGRGKFVFKAFPPQAQVSPLFGFAMAGKQLFAGGNFGGVLPYEGRYDADFGDILSVEKNGNFKAFSLANYNLMLKGEVRDIKRVRTANGDIYAVALNNKPIRFYRFKN
ncbi:VCBS repeat-containing protein [Mucilaginibacter ginkgonis]|uniref:VCBS repeat-containing protein n=1 Tax=Mucilaginibacter ginkgonis TaxID=2682091 RepID=A0A6I4INA9_9SPHI|nr:VCBS repeat-containing protein [Mucilaginibacter ginkgonis]QQL51465.1 VCBS repeat-containing protein [Mucilaginibacter ginkgonis]